jgi:hypothetical protein
MLELLRDMSLEASDLNVSSFSRAFSSLYKTKQKVRRPQVVLLSRLQCKSVIIGRTMDYKYYIETVLNLPFIKGVRKFAGNLLSSCRRKFASCFLGVVTLKGTGVARFFASSFFH